MGKALLYMVGVGPGDPELMTLKSVRIIRESEVVFVPVKNKDSKKSLALDIVEKVIELREKEIVYLHFPMVKGGENMRPYFDAAADLVKAKMRDFAIGVFITLGCSTIYSTPGNLFSVLGLDAIEVRFVPGVSSINAAAAATGEPMVYSEEKMAVLPAAYSADEIENTIKQFDTVVLMKAHTSTNHILRIARRLDLEKSSWLVERASSEWERVISLSEFDENEKPHYMSSIIVKKK